jgi:hypothetical protein
LEETTMAIQEFRNLLAFVLGVARVAGILPLLM